MELTKQQLERQDFVDNAIHDLIRTVAPVGANIPWDIKLIGSIRDIIESQLCHETNLMTEQEFYPYLEE
jgi:hypothetical protein